MTTDYVPVAIISEASARRVAVLGVRVQMERAAAGLTRPRLAKALGMDTSRLEAIESGQTPFVTESLLRRLAEVFKIDAGLLIDPNGAPPPEPFKAEHLSIVPVAPDGSALRSARRRARVTRRKLARTLGLPLPQIRATEKGLSTPAYTLARICTALGVGRPSDMVVGDVPGEAEATLAAPLPFGIRLVARDPAVV